MTDIFDYVVVGSGCAGSMSAQTLIESGKKVVMIDTGMSDEGYDNYVPKDDYLNLRKNDSDQYKYLIGENGEGIGWGEVSKGAQITPTRKHMTKGVNEYIPIESKTFSPLESLGYGGLGISWGLQCWELSDTDLKNTGLDPRKMRGAYETVSKRIGISGTSDEAKKYTLGELRSYQRSADMDENHRHLYNRYSSHAKKLQKKGYYVGRTPLALITEDLNGRKAYQYRDTDYYTDNDRSAWRPWITVNDLKKNSNFKYIGSQLVLSFEEKLDIVEVSCLDIKTNKKNIFKTRKLIICSGAMGSARIVLRSLGNNSTKLPLLCNPHTYIPYVQPAMIGKGPDKHKLGFGQLSYFIDKIGDDSGLSVASTYSYQSLMLFRLVSQMPFNFKDDLNMMRYLVSGFLVMIVQHPDYFSKDKYLQLTPTPDSQTGDSLNAHYELTSAEEKKWSRRETDYISLMRSLRAIAVKRVRTEHGSSIHYAGTVPFSDKNNEFTLSKTGRINGTKNVYIADSSGFNFLPAKGLTFSLMANSIITTENAINNM
jgi:hypothetical protein